MPETRLETITPKIAERYLTCNTRNRRVRKTFVDFLTRAILEDRFHLTHQGIAFNGDGSLIDGQHRLLAVVQADRPVKMFVTRDLECDALYGIDQGTPRRADDIAGPLGLGLDLVRNHFATARTLQNGFPPAGGSRARRRISHEELIRFALQHRDAILFGHEVVRSTMFHNATIHAVLARSYYTADRERVCEFGAMLTSGLSSSPGDAGAIIFARVFLRDHVAFGGWQGRGVLYRKTECALRAFLRREPIKKLVEVESEVFPIPSETGSSSDE